MSKAVRLVIDEHAAQAVDEPASDCACRRQLGREACEVADPLRPFRVVAEVEIVGQCDIQPDPRDDVYRFIRQRARFGQNAAELAVVGDEVVRPLQRNAADAELFQRVDEPHADRKRQRRQVAWLGGERVGDGKAKTRTGGRPPGSTMTATPCCLVVGYRHAKVARTRRFAAHQVGVGRFDGREGLESFQPAQCKLAERRTNDLGVKIAHRHPVRFSA